MVLNEKQLRKLSTKRLLLYKKKHFPYEGVMWKKCIYTCANFEDWNECRKCETVGKQYFETYALIKSILASREHIEIKS